MDTPRSTGVLFGGTGDDALARRITYQIGGDISGAPWFQGGAGQVMPSYDARGPRLHRPSQAPPYRRLTTDALDLAAVDLAMRPADNPTGGAQPLSSHLSRLGQRHREGFNVAMDMSPGIPAVDAGSPS